MSGTIYGLCDLDGSLRYVGQTVTDVQVRYQSHLRDRGTATSKGRWMQGLRENGVQPVLKVLESDVPKSELKERENAWIRKARSEGCDLTNMVAGSEWCSDEVRAKISSALTGRVLSPELRAKMSATHKGKPWSSKRREAHRPYTWDQASRERLAAVQRGRTPSSETRRKLKAAKAADRALPRSCPFCEALFSGSLGLSIHVTKTHNVSLRDLTRLALQADPIQAKALLREIEDGDRGIKELAR